MARAALILTALIAALAAGAQAAEAPALVDEEAAQGEVGRMSADEAENFRLLAEELEINFGAEKAAEPGKATGTLSDVAEKDAPAAVEAIRGLRAAEQDGRRKGAENVLASQDAILAKVRSLMDTSAGAIEAETLSGRAEAIIAAQRDAEEDTRAAAAKTLGKAMTDLTADEKSAVEQIAERQEEIARQAASLEKSAAQVAETAPDQLMRERAQKALSAGSLAEAKKAMEDSAEAIAENRLAQAVGRQNEAVRRMEEFRGALSGAEAPPAEARLGKIAARQKELAQETGAATSADKAGETAALQETLGSETARLAEDIAG